MAHVPEHIVVAEILPRAHADLPIDTRVQFKLQPRKMQWSSVHDVLTAHLQDRMVDIENNGYLDWNDMPLLVLKNTTVYEPGTLDGNPYDLYEFGLYIYWNESKELEYHLVKQWLVTSETFRRLNPDKYGGSLVVKRERVAIAMCE